MRAGVDGAAASRRDSSHTTKKYQDFALLDLCQYFQYIEVRQQPTSQDAPSDVHVRTSFPTCLTAVFGQRGQIPAMVTMKHQDLDPAKLFYLFQ